MNSLESFLSAMVFLMAYIFLYLTPAFDLGYLGRSGMPAVTATPSFLNTGASVDRSLTGLEKILIVPIRNACFSNGVCLFITMAGPRIFLCDSFQILTAPFAQNLIEAADGG